MTFILEFHPFRGFAFVVQPNLLFVGIGFVTLVGMAHTMPEHNRCVEARLLRKIEEGGGGHE